MLDAGLAILVQLVLTGVWGTYLWRQARHEIARNEWALVLGKLATPAGLWAFFGVGGIVVLVYPLPAEEYYGIAFSDASVLAVALIALGASVIFSWMFDKAFSSTISRKVHTTIAPGWSTSAAITWILVGAFLVDLVLRVRLVRGGAYFAWLVGLIDTSVSSGINTDPLFQLQTTLWPFVASLAAYLAFSLQRGRWLPISILMLEGMAVFLTGQRFPFAMFALIVGIVALIARPSSLRKVLLVGALGGMVFVLFIAPAIQVARFDLQSDAIGFANQPELIAVRFLTEYLPAGFLRDDERILDSPESQFWPRTAASMAYAASIQDQIARGQNLLTDADLYAALLQTVPRALLPEKPSIDSDALVQRHFNFRLPTVDASGTIIADALAHKYVAGVAALYAIGGVLLGIGTGVVRRRSRELSAVFLAAALPVFLPIGDSYAYYLSNLRNYILVAGVLWMTIWASNRHTGASTQDTSLEVYIALRNVEPRRAEQDTPVARRGS